MKFRYSAVFSKSYGSSTESGTVMVAAADDDDFMAVVELKAVSVGVFAFVVLRFFFDAELPCF